MTSMHTFDLNPDEHEKDRELTKDELTFMRDWNAMNPYFEIVTDEDDDENG